MSRIADLLNEIDDTGDSDKELLTTPSLKLNLESNRFSVCSSLSSSISSSSSSPLNVIGKKTSTKEVGLLLGRIPKSRINPKFLINKDIIKISLRSKSVSKTRPLYESYSKLHLKSLKVGLRIRLTLAPSLVSLYRNLSPSVSTKKVRIINPTNAKITSSIDFADEDTLLVSKSVQLVDSSLVNILGISSKTLQSLKKKPDGEQYPIFNSLDTAIQSLFGIAEYTLVRVTRSTTNDLDGSTLLKLESANPGNAWLMDHEEFLEEMSFSLGNIGETPSNLFIKKICARPRYKADMKIYFVPKRSYNSLYVDERMLERDLISGVVDCENITQREILTAFNYRPIWNEITHLIKLSNQAISNPLLQK